MPCHVILPVWNLEVSQSEHCLYHPPVIVVMLVSYKNKIKKGKKREMKDKIKIKD